MTMMMRRRRRRREDEEDGEGEEDEEDEEDEEERDEEDEEEDEEEREDLVQFSQQFKQRDRALAVATWSCHFMASTVRRITSLSCTSVQRSRSET